MLSRFIRSGSGCKAVQMRCLSVHEFQAKGLLAEYGCSTEFGVPARTLGEVATACEQIETDHFVVKAQILAGGRGKGTFKSGFRGGVHIAKSPRRGSFHCGENAR